MGATTYTPSSPLAEGIWYWRVLANDSQGDLSDFSSVWSFSIDVTPPTWDFQPVDQIVEFGDAFSYDIGASDVSGIDYYWVNDTQFSIDGDGLITNATDLTVGIYWLELRAYDIYDNYCSATFRVTVQDTTSPTWDEVPGDHHFEESIPFVYDVNATDLAGIDHYWVNDTHFSVDINGLITNATYLTPDVYWLEIRAYDPSHNYCTATIRIDVDALAPPEWVEEPTDQTVEFGDSFYYDLNATDLSGLDRWWLNDTARFAIDVDGVITDVVLLPVGKYGLKVWVNDTLGLTQMSTFTVTVHDTTPPSWVGIPSNRRVLSWRNFTYDLNAQDLSGLDTWWINDTVNFAIDGDGVITNATFLYGGLYGIRVFVNDTYNNILEASFTVDVKFCPNPPIVIESDEDFETQGWPGTGTEGDPFIIEDQIINLYGTGGYCIYITHTRVHFEIRNCTLGGATTYPHAAIYLHNVSNAVISDNTLIGNFYGIHFSNTSHSIITSNNCTGFTIGFYFSDVSQFNIVSHNLLASGTNDGIRFYYAANNTIYNNTVSGGYYSISIRYSSHVSVVRNNCTANVEFHYSGSSTVRQNDIGGSLRFYRSDSGTVTNNSATSIYLSYSHFYTISNNTVLGIGLSSASYNRISDNDCTGGYISSSYSSFNVIINNNCSGSTFYGLYMYRSSHCMVANNTFNNHVEWGIYLTGSFNVTIANTTCIGNRYGIYIYDYSSAEGQHVVVWNVFANNTQDAFAYRTYGSVFSHNYYSQYTGTTDEDNNGIGDTPYAIPGYGSRPVDYHPMMLPPGALPLWLVYPTDQVADYGYVFAYDVDATAYYPGIDEWWVNDTAHFMVDQYGMITNSTFLPFGSSYGLTVYANDTAGHVITAEFSITVQDNLPPEWVLSPGNQRLELGEDLYYDLDAYDPSGIELWWLSNYENFTIDQDGVITNVKPLIKGLYDIQVSVNDTLGNVATAAFVVAVDMYIPHGRIYLVGDASFANQGWPGSGTPTDPYRIEYLDISAGSYYYCIYVRATSVNFIIRDCLLHDSYVGIYLDGVANGQLINNTCASNEYGIRLYGSSSILISGNNCTSSYSSGIDLYVSSDIVIEDNTCTQNRYGILLTTCSDIVARNNVLTGNTNAGIRMYRCTSIVIEDNDCSQNRDYGIISSYGSHNILRNNTCTENSRYGIYFYRSHYSSLTNNTCINNRDYGIYLYYSDRNSVTWNVFGNSTTNAYDSRGSYNTFDYNFYSDYTGIDADGDSFGDTPHTFYNNQDPHPLMMPRWLTPPADQILEFGDIFRYKTEVQYFWNLDAWWLNDTTYFSIDSNGVITSIGLVPVGSYGLNVSVNDTRGAVLSGEFTITVIDTTPPSWVEMPVTQTVEFGTSFAYDLDATELSGIDYWWLNVTEGFVIDEDGVITNSTFHAVGVYSLEVRVYDIYGNYRSAEFRVLVVDTTDPVWIQTPSDRTVEFGDTFSYELFAYDLSGIHQWWINDTIRFFIDGNGVIVNATRLEVGEYWIEVRAIDPYDNYASATFRIIVQDTTPPSWIVVPTDQTSEFGEDFLYELEASDLSELGRWSVENGLFAIDWAGRLRTVRVLTPGNYGVTIHVSDIYGNTLSARITVTVVDTTPPEWGASLLDQTLEYGESLSYQLVASDLSGLDSWWLNDTAHFQVDIYGLVTEVTPLSEGVYGLKVWVNDTLGNVQWGVFKVTVLGAWSLVEVLDLELSGSFDFLLKEKIHLQLAALLTDAATGNPVSGANVTATIYGPAPNDDNDDDDNGGGSEQFIMTVTLVEEESGSGVYIFTTEQTMHELGLEKGIYLVYCTATLDDLQAVDMIQFHIDPPSEEGTGTYVGFNVLLVLSAGIMLGGFATVVVIVVVKQRISRIKG